MSHVAGQPKSLWISFTRDEAIAKGRFGEFGYVKVDRGLITSDIIDVSEGWVGKPGTINEMAQWGDVPAKLERAQMLSNWARANREVLVREFVGPEAIVEVHPP